MYISLLTFFYSANYTAFPKEGNKYFSVRKIDMVRDLYNRIGLYG